MNIDGDSSYSRFKRADLPISPKARPRPTGVQKVLELGLFAVFGCTIALAGVALYATNRPEHRLVPNRVSTGIAADRVNVLLIGSSLVKRAGGENDIRIESLMLLSIQPSTGRAAMMSVPADLWTKVGRYGQRPLRTAHQVGDAGGYPGGGTGLTVDTVESIIDEPVHAYARFSIQDVARLVDALGGVDVEIKQGVYEYRSKFRFKRGVEHFDGRHATRYAYSGYIAGIPAANRFAREERQQDVVLAALSKAMKTKGNLDVLQPALGELAATNLEPADTDMLATALRRRDDVRRISFAPYLDAFNVKSAAYQGEAVRPRSGDFTTLQKIADAALVARVH
jgi:LCP family protein required for cell wall assembly